MTRLLGLDLGGTNIKAALVEVIDGDAQVLQTSSTPTHAEKGPDEVTRLIVSTGRQIIDEFSDVEALGTAVPGLFDYGTGEIVFLTNLPGAWEGFPLRRRLAEEFGMPVTLINDARAFTLAEAAIGAGKGCSTVVCMTLGTGIGGGVVIDGKLHFGAFGIAGEIGHQTLDQEGPECGCGNFGCLEALARAPRIAELAGTETFRDAMAAYVAGEERAVAAIDAAANYIGTGIANMITVLGPERVVIGGGGAQAGAPLFAAIRQVVLKRARLVPEEFIQIVPAELGSPAGAIGAALAARGSPSGDMRFLQGEVPSAVQRRSAI